MKRLYEVAGLAAFLLTAGAGNTHASLLSFWNFDEGSGSIAHDSVGGVDGTLAGSAAFVAGGVTGGALSIPSGGSLVNMGDNFEFNNSSSYSLQVWVKLAVNDASGYIPLARHYTGYANGYFIAIGPTTGDGCGSEPPGSTHFYTEYPCTPSSSLLVNDGAWHQIIGTFSGGVARVYVDGQLQGTSSGTTLNPRDGVPFLVGGLDVGGNPTTTYIGLIDNVAVWDNVLTPGDTVNLYSEETGAAPEPGSIWAVSGAAVALACFRKRRQVR